MMVFVNEDRRTTTCSLDFNELNHFIASFSRAAGEMARRRGDQIRGGDRIGDGSASPPGPINVSSAAFKLCADDGYVLGALAGNAGEVVGIRMCPDIASQMTRAMLQTLPAMSRS
jgi:hypothetical protein